MNDQQRAAMQMALEASEALMAWCVKNVDKWDFPQWDYLDTANERLREALAQPQDHSEQHLNMVKGLWVDLTDDELKAALEVHQVGLSVRIGRIAIAAFKEKNK